MNEIIVLSLPIVLIILVAIIIIPKTRENCSCSGNTPFTMTTTDTSCVSGGGKVVRKNCYFRPGKVMNFPDVCLNREIGANSERANVKVCECSETQYWSIPQQQCRQNLM